MLHGRLNALLSAAGLEKVFLSFCNYICFIFCCFPDRIQYNTLECIEVSFQPLQTKDHACQLKSFPYISFEIQVNFKTYSSSSRISHQTISREERNIHYDPEQMAPPHDQLDDLSKTGELPDGQDLAGLEKEIETEIARNSEPLQEHSDSDFVGKDQSSKSLSDQARPLPFVDETVAEEEEE